MWQKPFYRWSRLKTWTSGQNQAKCNTSSAPRLAELLDFIIFISGGNILFLRRDVCVSRTESRLLLAEMIDISHPARSRGSQRGTELWVLHLAQIKCVSVWGGSDDNFCSSPSFSWLCECSVTRNSMNETETRRTDDWDQTASLMEWSSFSLENQQIQERFCSAARETSLLWFLWWEWRSCITWLYGHSSSGEFPSPPVKGHVSTSWPLMTEGGGAPESRSVQRSVSTYLLRLYSTCSEINHCEYTPADRK